MIVRDALDNGIRLVTESMSHVRSVSLGVWLTRGSRHETDEESGIAHFVEHMLFKGTATRTAEDIAQAVDSIGGQLDAFTAKEYASYYVKVLDEHLPMAVDILSDIVLRPAFHEVDIEREKKVILEEIKMVEDTPDDLVHEIFTQAFWEGHPLGRPILGTKESVEALTQQRLRDHFRGAYAAENVIISAAGNLEHAQLREALEKAFGSMPASGLEQNGGPPHVVPKVVIRNKELEQSHVCLGTPSYPQNHGDRYASYVMNTMFGGSMSSRLFQNIREKRGLAYSVFSGINAYRDAGYLTVYAGCANDAVGEVIDLVVEEMKRMKQSPVPDSELRRAKDHLKGSVMLSLENTSSRMSHLARQEIYFDRQFSLDETLQGIERVTPVDVQRVAGELFSNGSLAATVLGQVNGLQLPRERLESELNDSSLHPPRNGAHLERRAEIRDLAAGRNRGCRGDGGGWNHSPRCRARHQRAIEVRRRAHRGHRRNHPARRHRVHDRRGRARRAVLPLAALRPHVFRRRRYRAGDSDARGDRPAASRTWTGCSTPLRARAEEHRHTPMIGRTHGVHAEPMTFGLKLALWYAELRRDRDAWSAREPSSRSARSRARSARSRISIRRSRRRSAGGSGSSRRRCRRR